MAGALADPRRGANSHLEDERRSRSDPSPRSDRRLEAAARRWTGDSRTATQLREHYAIEHRLAERLLRAPTAERGALYARVYDELFASIPHHPQLLLRASRERATRVERELYFLAPLLDPELSVLEIGAGDQALSRRLARIVGEVHAVDVASEIASPRPAVENLHTYLTDGRRLPLATDSIDLAYSNQLMEHLHPEDAIEQLREVFRVLSPGGRYLCVTPNRLTGPWDISRMFSTAPTGLHLREYSNRELAETLREAGFGRIHAVVPAGVSGARVVPAWLFTLPERVLQGLPHHARRAVLAGPWRKPLNSVRLLAEKPMMRRTPR